MSTCSCTFTENTCHRFTRYRLLLPPVMKAYKHSCCNLVEKDHKTLCSYLHMQAELGCSSCMQTCRQDTGKIGGQWYGSQQWGKTTTKPQINRALHHRVGNITKVIGQWFMNRLEIVDSVTIFDEELSKDYSNILYEKGRSQMGRGTDNRK